MNRHADLLPGVSQPADVLPSSSAGALSVVVLRAPGLRVRAQWRKQATPVPAGGLRRLLQHPSQDVAQSFQTLTLIAITRCVLGLFRVVFASVFTCRPHDRQSGSWGFVNVRKVVGKFRNAYR